MLVEERDLKDNQESRRGFYENKGFISISGWTEGSTGLQGSGGGGREALAWGAATKQSPWWIKGESNGVGESRGFLLA